MIAPSYELRGLYYETFLPHPPGRHSFASSLFLAYLLHDPLLYGSSYLMANILIDDDYRAH